MPTNDELRAMIERLETVVPWYKRDGMEHADEVSDLRAGNSKAAVMLRAILAEREGTPANFMGFPVRIDSHIPANEMRFVDQRTGQIVGAVKLSEE